MNIREFVASGAKLEVKKYVGINEKFKRAEKIVKSVCFKNDRFLKDKVMVKVFTFLEGIDMYTNIDVDFKNAAEEYDAAIQAGINGKLGVDYLVFDEMVHDMMHDYYENTTTASAVVYDAVEKIKSLGPVLIDGLVSALNKMDDGQIDKLVGKLKK